MIKSKKQMFMVITSFILIMLLTTVTYAFFNYTRTGVANRIQVGRIYFNSEQGNSINLTNVFPIASSEIDNDTDNVGSVSIHITGDTTYSEGVEYLISAVDVNNTINDKTIPISLDISYEAANNRSVGINDVEYFENRGGTTSRYKILYKKITSNDTQLLVGYIKPDENGIDGTITIKSFLDKDKIAISDTYPQKHKYLVNPNMTEEEMADCVSYMNNRHYFSGDNNATNYCEGTGKLNNQTFQEEIDSSDLYSYSDINTMLENNIIIEMWENGTTSEWVGNKSIFTTAEWNSLQQNGISFKVKVEANEGIWVEEKFTTNVMNEIPTSIFTSALCKNVDEIYFERMDENTMNERFNASSIKADITYNGQGKVLAWLEENETDNSKYTMYLVSDGETYMTSVDSIFYSAFLTNAKVIELNNVNLSMASGMNRFFYNCYEVKSLDLTKLKGTENLVYGEYMFSDCNELVSLDMSGLNLNKLETASYMFKRCKKLKEINFDNIISNSMTTMNYMFYECNSIEELDLSSFAGGQVQYLNAIFSNCTKLKNVKMIGFNLTNATVTSAFEGLNNIEELDLSNSILPIYSTNLFKNSTSLKKIILSNVDTSYVVSFISMFENCINLEELDLGSFDLSNATDISYMFYNCDKLTEINLSGQVINKITKMESMFYDSDNLIKINISGLGSDNLSNINYMFGSCENLKEINMSNFNFGVASTSELFSNHFKLENINLSNSNTSNVTDMNNMFYNCTALVNIDLSSFDTGSVTNMNSMFYNCTSLINLDLSNFNMINVSSCTSMFYGCTSLKTIDLSGVTTTGLTYNMFYNCPLLETIYVSEDIDFSNQPDNMPIFGNNTSLVGGAGTTFDTNNPVDKTYAKIDGGESNPGYFTLKTN